MNKNLNYILKTAISFTDIAVLSYSRFFKMGKKWVNLSLHTRKLLILRRLFARRFHCREQQNITDCR